MKGELQVRESYCRWRKGVAGVKGERDAVSVKRDALKLCRRYTQKVSVSKERDIKTGYSSLTSGPRLVRVMSRRKDFRLLWYSGFHGLSLLGGFFGDLKCIMHSCLNGSLTLFS